MTFKKPVPSLSFLHTPYQYSVTTVIPYDLVTTHPIGFFLNHEILGVMMSTYKNFLCHLTYCNTGSCKVYSNP